MERERIKCWRCGLTIVLMQRLKQYEDGCEFIRCPHCNSKNYEVS